MRFWDWQGFRSESLVLQLAMASCLFLILAVWLACPLALQDLWRRTKRDDRQQLWVAALLFVAAFALRWWLPVHSYVHENNHSYRFLSFGPLNAGVEPQGIPSTLWMLAKLVQTLLPESRDGMFLINALASSACVPGLYGLGRLAFDQPRAGLLAALFLLLQPLAIALAPTEEFMVMASGALIVGCLALFAGVRRGVLSWQLLGTALICFAASVREVALLLAPLVPIVALAGSPRDKRYAWRVALVHSAAAAALLLPRAIAIKEAAAAAPSVSFINAGNTLRIALFTSEHWVGYEPPYIPRWMSLLILLGVGFQLYEFARSRDLRRLLVGVVALLVIQVEAGVVSSGWFPSQLRHQYAALAFAMLPAGVFAAWLATLANRRWVQRGLLGGFLGLAAGSLMITGGYRIDRPVTQEYRFFRDALEKQPEQLAFVVLNTAQLGIPHIGPEWLYSRKPNAEMLTPTELQRRVSVGSQRPVLFLLDRRCFLNWRCVAQGLGGECTSAEQRAKLNYEQTRFGRVSRECAAVLRSADFRVVDSRPIESLAPPYDLPASDPEISIALLSWDGRRSARPPLPK